MKEELEVGAPSLPVEFRTPGWRGLGPLTQTQAFCIIFPEMGLAGDQVKIFVASGSLWSLGWCLWLLLNSRVGCG